MNQENKSQSPLSKFTQKQEDLDYGMSSCINNRYNILSESETKCFMALFSKNQNLLKVL